MTEPGESATPVAVESGLRTAPETVADVTTVPVTAANVTAGPEIAAEDEVPEDDDADSLSSPSLASSTTSLGSSIMRHRMENGRRYHAYKEGAYILPNDDPELERLELQHAMYTLTYDGKLFTCPAGQDKPIGRVLDCGTATGVWAIDIGDEFPGAEVIGVDLSPVQSAFTPPNVQFFVDDLEAPWTFAKKFDFIHVRMMTGSFKDFPKFFQQCYDNLNPGGWIEVSDITFPVECDDESFPKDSNLQKWSDYMLEASRKLGQPLDSCKLYDAQIVEAGFSNLSLQKYKWPHNGWPKDPKYKELGQWTYENVAVGLSGLSMFLFTHGLGWSPEETEVFLAGVRKDMKDTRMHTYYYIYSFQAQRPE